MKTRREAIRLLLSAGAAMVAVLTAAGAGLRWAYAEVKKRLLPRGTRMDTLVDEDPAHLDTRQLDVTPMAEFDTMGQTNYSISAENWRLAVDGAVDRPTSFTYAELTAMPAIERSVLLICPGFFAYNGRWKGVSVKGLLAGAGMSAGAKAVEFRGPEHPRELSARFDLEEILSDRVFLAYEVNGKTLPQRHGFPLRLVAEDHYGGRWIKYVYQISVVDQ
ncbi:MAG: molybdopterin-dependent oxidoreductase [Desulfobacterales bacterium]|nr:molybdopterin-dependent oxidoreductase [Desulfobacterales bacterium]